MGLGPYAHKQRPQNLLEMLKLVKKDKKNIPNEYIKANIAKY